MDPVAISMTVFKGAACLIWMLQRKRVLEKLRKDGDVTDQNFRQWLLSEIDNVSLKLDKQSLKDLKTSHSFYMEGLAHLNKVINDANVRKKGTDTTTQAAKGPELIRGSTFLADETTPSSEDLKLLNRAGLDESAEKTISLAKEAFMQASIIATYAFNDENLKTYERVDAMYIRLMGKILQNMEYPSNTLPTCAVYLGEMYKVSNIKKIFRDAVTNKGKKSPFSKVEEDIKVFVGVCHLQRLIYDHVVRFDTQHSGPWSWPSIKIEESETTPDWVDPLRDARVAVELCKLQGKQAENVLVSAVDLPIAWTFGTEFEKLISPKDIATSTEGHLIVADDGDCKIKFFDESGKLLDKSFHLIPCRLDDEDVLSVTTDRDDNLFVLIGIDKYRYEVYVFNTQGRLYHKFRLKEGFVHCSPVVKENNEVLVVIEDKESKCSAVEVYKADGQYLHERRFGQEILKEPKDMTVDNKGCLVILNGDSRVFIFNELGEHLPMESTDVVPSEAIAFHSTSQQFAVSSSITSGPGSLVKISIYNRNRRKCVNCIHQGEERSEKQEKESVPPKMAVTQDGRIAILAGIVGDCKVIVV